MTTIILVPEYSSCIQQYSEKEYARGQGRLYTHTVSEYDKARLGMCFKINQYFSQ